jgi:hypothetical protein
MCGELSADGGTGGAAILKVVEGGLPGGDGGRGRIRLVGWQTDCHNSEETIMATQATLDNGVLGGRTEAGGLMKVFIQGPTGMFDFENGQMISADASGNWSINVPKNITKSEQVSVMQRVATQGLNSEDNSMWILAPVNVIAQGVAEVSTHVQHSLKIARTGQIGEHLIIALTGDANTSVSIKLVDVLGRELEGTSAYISSEGVANVILNTSKYPAGHYIVIAANGIAMTSKNVQLVR